MAKSYDARGGLSSQCTSHAIWIMDSLYAEDEAARHSSGMHRALVFAACCTGNCAATMMAIRFATRCDLRRLKCVGIGMQ